MEQRSKIKLLNFEGVLSIEIHLQHWNFYDMHGGQVVSVQHVQKWCREFLVKRENVKGEARSGRMRTVLTSHYVSRIKH